MPLKILTLNIEENKHFDLILPFLRENQFDVICLQEVFQSTLPKLAEAAKAETHFVPLADIQTEVWGVALLVREGLNTTATSQKYYKGEGMASLESHASLSQTPNAVSRAILSATIEKDGQPYTVTTTHFTWADKGGTNPDQARDLIELEKSLDQVGETILCGDFNAPRGTSEIFAALAKKYHDNIPAEVTTSIDQELHRVKGLQLMVDGMFSSPRYQLQNVQVLNGLSDHCGVRADVFLL